MNNPEMKSRARRIRLFIRLFLPMFSISYPLAAILGFIFSGFHFDWTSLLLATSVGVLSGFAVSVAWDILMNRPVGIPGSIWLGLWLGMWAGLSWRFWAGILLTTIGGIALGAAVVKGIGKSTAFNIEEHKRYSEDLITRLNKTGASPQEAFKVAVEFAGIVVPFFIWGATDLIEHLQVRHIGITIKRWLLLSAAGFIISLLLISLLPSSVAVTTILPIWWAITMGSIAGILAGLTLRLVRNNTVYWAVGVSCGVIIGTMIGDFTFSKVTEIIIAVTPAFITALACGIGIYIGTKIISETSRTSLLILLIGLPLGIIAGYLARDISAIIEFLLFLCYIISYYQLPLWLLSSISVALAGEAAEENPSDVFTYLRGSALYWDEWDTLPLQGLAYIEWIKIYTFKYTSILKDMMEVAFERDIQQTLEVMVFIETERPLQVETARVGLRAGFLTLITRELGAQKTLRDISEATQNITKLQTLEGHLHMSSWSNLFTLLIDVCLDAAHFLNSLGWQARHDALQNMITSLSNIKESAGSLVSVLERWESAAQHELDKLNQEPQKTDQINNPYIVGPVLDEPRTSLFVGRRDLAEQLEQALRRGSQRFTFFLVGERRMGKSSTLKQLPYLLDDRYFLPISYDLQAPEMSSSIAAFLSTVAEKIYETMDHRRVSIEKLEIESLREASRENEAAVYYSFNEWLRGVERILEQNNQTLLLSFDEFENLEKVAQAKSLDLHLLLSWFRSIIQNRPRLALLFSGGKTVGEMSIDTGINWSGYFVNVRTLKVRFLRPIEARQLITQPVPDYPIGQIFGEGVVDEIIQVTGCHPFLVQAVCWNLIDNLNADNRSKAEIQDVAVAVEQVLEEWWDGYFQDLWNRSDEDQQTCLVALNNLGKASFQQIIQKNSHGIITAQSTLSTLRHTLQTLLKRDLVLQENGIYRIAAPIFSEWVTRSI